jgi:hypothetical protein
MKKKATIIAIVFFTSIGFAQNGAKIEFKAENNTIDYGTITKGRDNGIRVFEFTNTGTTPLIIYAVQSTASSTVLSKQTDTVLPGKSSKIEVKVWPWDLSEKQLLWNLMLLIMTEAEFL